jgi:phosphoribosylamine--glycine ligase
LTKTILLIGGGGREHALAWKLASSPLCGRLYAAPGNPGIAEHAELVDLDPVNHGAVIAFCQARQVDLVVVGPEAPLVDGLADSLAASGIAVFGPSKEAARLEGSKVFTKELCREADIPTAAFARFDNAAAASAYVQAQGAPIVIKADGLAAGKGVTVAATVAEAQAAIADCFAGTFGAAGHEVVVEAFLEGEEASFFALCDGQNVLPLGHAQDHKAVGEGDTGPNTGGMGAYSPAPVMDAAMIEITMATIIRPTVATLARRGTPYRGVLFAGLMITSQGPQLIEYNCRFGDPETQILMQRLESDLVDLMLVTIEGRLDSQSVMWSDDAALSVVLASRGYPGAYKKGGSIKGIERANGMSGVKVFHAGTAVEDGELVAAGGRVLSVSAKAPTIAQAQSQAYAAVDQIDWPGGFCRRDIGWRAVGRG